MFFLNLDVLGNNNRKMLIELICKVFIAWIIVLRKYSKSMFLWTWMRSETITQKMSLSSFVKLLAWTIVLRNIWKINGLLNPNVFGKLYLLIFYNMKCSAYEYLKNSWFSEPKCVWKQYPKNWLIESICTIVIAWTAMLRNISKRQCFALPIRVWKQ